MGKEGSSTSSDGVLQSFRRPRFLPPHMFLLLILAMITAARWLPQPRWIYGDWRWWGLLPLLTGLAFALSASRLFSRRGTAIRPLDPSSSLVEEGPFRWSRNPMYVGLTMTLLGLAIVLGNAASFAAPVVFALWVWAVFVRREEIHMEQQFGSAYREYCGRVRRWI